jgi:hypothetical protein
MATNPAPFNGEAGKPHRYYEQLLASWEKQDWRKATRDLNCPEDILDAFLDKDRSMIEYVVVHPNFPISKAMALYDLKAKDVDFDILRKKNNEDYKISSSYLAIITRPDLSGDDIRYLFQYTIYKGKEDNGKKNYHNLFNNVTQMLALATCPTDIIEAYIFSGSEEERYNIAMNHIENDEYAYWLIDSSIDKEPLDWHRLVALYTKNFSENLTCLEKQDRFSVETSLDSILKILAKSEKLPDKYLESIVDSLDTIFGNTIYGQELVTTYTKSIERLSLYAQYSNSGGALKKIISNSDIPKNLRVIAALRYNHREELDIASKLKTIPRVPKEVPLE